jgi:transposase
MTKKKQRKTYTEAFRREAVRLADQPGRDATEVAQELGINVGQIYNWRTQFNKLSKGQFTVADGTNYAKSEPEEIRRLKKRCCRRLKIDPLVRVLPIQN